ncbi:MAG: hypothetical protein AB8I08_24845 [Sandaracinaceae bacterium]
MRRKHLPWLALGAVIVALMAANILATEDPEPTSSDDSSSGTDEPTTEPTAEPTARRHVDDAPEAREDPPSDDPAGDETEADSTVVGCDHPLIAAESRHHRIYRWTQSDIARTAELRIRPRRTRERTDGERVVTWAVRVQAEDDDSELGEAVMETRCVPSHDAEEPWFGILERSLGLTLTDAPGRWRWPAELAEGLRFEGTASFDPDGSDMQRPPDAVGPLVLRVTRHHVVERRERIEVPAGTFETWRVAYEENHAFGDRSETGNGVLWVAEGIGLVKSEAENAAGVTQTIELIRGTR